MRFLSKILIIIGTMFFCTNPVLAYAKSVSSMSNELSQNTEGNTNIWLNDDGLPFTFQEIFEMPIDELQFFCRSNDITFISESKAMALITCGYGFELLIKPDNYQFPENSYDVTVSSEITDIDSDTIYDYAKMMESLNLPEQYFLVNFAEGMNKIILQVDENGVETYHKFAVGSLRINYNTDESFIKLYQAFYVFVQLNPDINDKLSIFHSTYSNYLKKGDINLDDNISVVDIIILQKYLLGKLSLSEKEYIFADYNSDSIVNIYDLCLLKKSFISL